MGSVNPPKHLQPLLAVAMPALLPLATAARYAYARATGSHARDMETLNNVARLIATRTRIFTVDTDETARPVSAAIIAKGEFEDGGGSLRIRNCARAPIGMLAIRRDELANVMDEIRKVYGPTAP
jgi:hypothetical protein